MSRCAALVAGLLWLVSAANVGAEATNVEWEAAFPTRDAPAQVYFRAEYRDDLGRAHELQVWREGDLRLRRKTDEAIDLYVEKSASGEYVYRLIDHERKMLIEVDRTALYRIGVFSDWIGLAHVLDIPRGSYRIVQSPRQRPGMWRSDCAWRRLEPMTPPSSPTEICWSVRWGLPLEIATDGEIGGGKPRFSIREVRTFASEADIFDIAREGLLEIDAASDGEISD